MKINQGTRIDKYEIHELLGRGGMSEVYKVKHVDLQIDLSLKLISVERFPPDILPNVVKRFENEAKKMAQLNHPNIVRVTDYGVFNGIPYFVMDHCAGGTLKRFLGKPMPYQQAINLLIPIADALVYAHNKGVIHRDVKPSNILLSEQGVAKLADFGVAKVMEDNEMNGLTATGAAIGTPEYMAPEQALGKSIDQRVDIYSLGVILYELITGLRPFQAETPMQVVLKQSTELPSIPREIIKNLPIEVEKLILKALAKNPNERYANMQIFAEELRLIKASDYVVDKPRVIEDKISFKPQTTTRSQTKNMRNPSKLILPGIIGLALVVIAGILLGQMRKDQIDDQAAQSGKLDTTTAVTLTPQMTSTPAPTLTPTLGVGSSVVAEGDGMVMMYVPAGEFMMGSESGDADETPVHAVSLDAFWIDQTEVTNAQYKLCVDAGVCEEPGRFFFKDNEYADHPVIYLFWEYANDYCQWVGRRLPTEAEWEKAACGTDGRKYPWGDKNPSDELVLVSLSEEDTRKVGSFPLGASPYGVLDMSGNAGEWVADWYDEGYYQISPTENPQGPNSGKLRVIRGFQFTCRDRNIRSTLVIEEQGFDWLKYDSILKAPWGFRCAMDAD